MIKRSTLHLEWGELGPNYACVCSKVKDMRHFSLQVSEMSEKTSLKMGLKFAALLNMGER